MHLWISLICIKCQQNCSLFKTFAKIELSWKTFWFLFFKLNKIAWSDIKQFNFSSHFSSFLYLFTGANFAVVCKIQASYGAYNWYEPTYLSLNAKCPAKPILVWCKSLQTVLLPTSIHKLKFWPSRAKNLYFSQVI